MKLSLDSPRCAGESKFISECVCDFHLFGKFLSLTLEAKETTIEWSKEKVKREGERGLR
jgi:hypothetical protein